MRFIDIDMKAMAPLAEVSDKKKNVHSVIQAGFITGLVWLRVGLIERKKSNRAEKRMTDSKHRRINVIVITPNKSLGVSWRWWPLLWTSFIFVRHVMSLFYTASIAAFCIFSSDCLVGLSLHQSFLLNSPSLSQPFPASLCWIPARLPVISIDSDQQCTWVIIYHQTLRAEDRNRQYQLK